MAKFEVKVGRYVVGSAGVVQDDLRPVEFEGEKLATLQSYGSDMRGEPTDSRGATQTLYRAEGGRLVVHVELWSHWQGEPNIRTLHAVSEADLQPGGPFEALGREAGFGRALTLDEALSAHCAAGGDDLDS